MIALLKSKYDIPEALGEVLKNLGFTSLHPPQEEALASGVLRGENLVLAIPTAAGKTLVAELCMIKSVLERKGRCLYIVPLRALASEKCEEFRKRYGPLGISIGVATGEYDMPGNRLSRFDILVATSEKVDSLLRMRTRWLGESLSIVVLDEIHYIHDPTRGPTLEIIAARLRQINPHVQILALSATIRNGRELAGWLGAKLVASDWRPVPLLEGVYARNTIHYADHSTRSLVAAKTMPVIALVNDTLNDGGQTLVFVSSRRSTIAVARSLRPHVERILSPGDRKALSDIADAACHVLTEPTHLCQELAESIRHGVAFHHAGLHAGQRKLVEDAFRANRIKAIAATPTLGAGVNLPARRVIIRDWTRYEMGRGSLPIPVFEYKQFAGRAGRPGYDSEGEAILVAKKEGDVELLFEHYIRSASEPLRSKLGTQGALASHILASIASGYAASLDEIMSFLALTFFACQNDVESLARAVEEILRFLLREGLIQCEGKLAPDFTPSPGAGFRPTPFGSIVSRLYLDPRSGLVLKEGLLAAGRHKAAEDALLHLACCCPDMDLLNVGRERFSELELEALAGTRRLLFLYPEDGSEEARYRYLQAMLTAEMISVWLKEEPEDVICDTFGIGPGDLRRIVESADWLLYSAEQLAALEHTEGVRPLLEELRQRVRYGIKKELLELVSLKGIGRVRARKLFRKGYRTMEALRTAGEKELADVPTIGPLIAASIKKQLRGHSS